MFLITVNNNVNGDVNNVMFEVPSKMGAIIITFEHPRESRTVIAKCKLILS